MDVAPLVIALEGHLGLDRFAEVHDALERAKGEGDRHPLVMDLSGVRSVDGMVGADIVLFLRRRLRHRRPLVIVAPVVRPEWVENAGSLENAVFAPDRASALDVLGAMRDDGR